MALGGRYYYLYFTDEEPQAKGVDKFTQGHQKVKIPLIIICTGLIPNTGVLLKCRL